ncbi:MAG: hypothetical protein ACREHG_03140, partial [Candidatus Saccharimonadales bacterium]
ADIIGGSDRTIQLELRTAADVRVTDSQYGANIYSTSNGSTTTWSVVQAGTLSINAGTITVQKTAGSPSGNVVLNANSQTLAEYTLTASGEAVKIDTITAEATPSGACKALRNGAIYANGVQVGSTADLNTNNATTTYTSYNMGSSLVVQPGTPVTLDIKADVYCSNGTALANNDTVKATLLAGASNGMGQVSYTTINVPAGLIDGNTLTVKTGSLTLSKYTAYTNQTVVVPRTALELAHYTLTNSTTEAVNLNEFDVTNTITPASTMTNEYVTYGTQKTSVTANPSASQTYSVSYSLAAGQTIDVEVYADLASTATATGVSIMVKGTTALSATAVATGTQPNG